MKWRLPVATQFVLASLLFELLLESGLGRWCGLSRLRRRLCRRASAWRGCLRNRALVLARGRSRQQKPGQRQRQTI